MKPMTENTKPAEATRKTRKAAPARDSEATQSRIFEAARTLFSQNSYEGVGLREIASGAGVDPALVIRYFGSKEGLFRAIVAQAFGAEEFLERGADSLPKSAARMLSRSVKGDEWRSGYDPLRLLLCSIGSATAGPIVSEYLCSDFILPIASALSGNRRNERAVLLAGSVVGVALIRLALASGGDYALKHRALKDMMEEALAALVNNGGNGDA